MTPKERLIAAIENRETDRPPVWLLRQAGRYLPEYRAVKDKHATKAMMTTPEIAAEITVQPVRIIGVDAAILYSDILMIPDAMGMGLDFATGEGPVFSFAANSSAAIGRLKTEKLHERLAYVFEAIRESLKLLPADFPLIGFAGAPFTVACYMIAGGAEEGFVSAKRLAWRDPAAFHHLMDLLATATADYLVAQAEAGVAAVQVFDTWAGLLSAEDYRTLAKPYTARVFQALRRRGIPSVHYVKGGGHLLKDMAGTGSHAIGVDWRTGLGEARATTGGSVAVQGNFDPDLLFAPQPVIAERLERMFADAGNPQSGYVVNLGHGVHRDTPVENVRFFVERAKALGLSSLRHSPS